MLICVISFSTRGFKYGVEFAGGTQYTFSAGKTSISVSDVSNAFTKAGHPLPNTASQVASGGNRKIVATLNKISGTDAQSVTNAVAKTLHLNSSAISVQSVSSSWGHDISVAAIEGLIVFLIAVSIYISFRFAWRMAVGGIIALLHDLVLAAGVYSVIGFEVTPSTVVGLLTILGFSLYDTVVVYDKVAENSRDLLAGSRMTYSEAANTAVNQTLMRSINTSLIALLPVAGLLFVGAGILGVGTIKDLALILFVGLASGAYSSLFLATPIVVDLTERAPEYKALTRRVVARQAADERRAADEAQLAAAGIAVPAAKRSSGPAPAPRPGARPQRKRK
jgi:preprotein translocase subunit SecF